MMEKIRSFFSHADVRAFLRHPASIIAWITLLCVVVKEQYPFSHFPMYSGFEKKTYFYWFAQDGEPIQAKRIFKTSIPRSKKLMSPYKKEAKKKNPKATDEEVEAVAGRKLLAYLRKTTTQKEKYAEVLNRPITLMRKNIEYEGGEFVTEDLIIVTD